MKDMVKELGSRNPFTLKRSLSDEYNRLALDSKIHKVNLGNERVKGDSFLTLSLPRGLSLTSKIVWH